MNPLLHRKYGTTVGPNKSLQENMVDSPRKGVKNLTKVASNYMSHTFHKANCKTPRDIKGAWDDESRFAEQQHQNQGIWYQKGNYGLSL